MAVNRHHPHFIGTYWGAIISPFCAEIVESADARLYAGPGYVAMEHFLIVRTIYQRNSNAIPRTAYENYNMILVPDGH